MHVLRRNHAVLTVKDGGLVSQLAWNRDLNGVGPVLVIAVESTNEVMDRFFGDQRCDLSEVEMSCLNSTPLQLLFVRRILGQNMHLGLG